MIDDKAEDNEYLLHALRIMEENSLRRHEVDWRLLEEETLRLGTDRHAALRFALARVDRHSFLHVPTDPQPQPNQSVSNQPTGQILRQGTRTIALVAVPGFSGVSSEAAQQYAEDLRKIIDDLACQGCDGWIIDLRQNPGGNMWPMLLGLGPLLGTGVLGYFDSGQSQLGWYCSNNAVGILDQNGHEHVLCQLHAQTSEQSLDCGTAPVAVLIGPTTASSGEALAVAFRGRKNCRFIGEKTNGLSSSNQPFVLSDGAEMWLTVAYFADRNGVRYESGLEPDQEVKSDTQGDDDPAIFSAMECLFAGDRT
jgi:carboxyl-terminal processing protease